LGLGFPVEGDSGSLTLLDVELVGVTLSAETTGTIPKGVGIAYKGGQNAEKFGALTLKNVTIHGFDTGIQSTDTADPVTIINTQVFGNTTAACDIASDQNGNKFLITAGSTGDDHTCPFMPTPEKLNTPTGSVRVRLSR
jgi:hypothetical protein